MLSLFLKFTLQIGYISDEIVGKKWGGGGDRLSYSKSGMDVHLLPVSHPIPLCICIALCKHGWIYKLNVLFLWNFGQNLSFTTNTVGLPHMPNHDI